MDSTLEPRGSARVFRFGGVDMTVGQAGFIDDEIDFPPASPRLRRLVKAIGTGRKPVRVMRTPAVWASARSSIGCRTSSGARKTRSATSTSSKGDSSGPSGDDPPPPAQPQRRGDEQDRGTQTLLRELAARVDQLAADAAEQSVRIMRRLDRLDGQASAIEQRCEQARRIALDALDLATDRGGR
jgi:hypothetical protein